MQPNPHPTFDAERHLRRKVDSVGAAFGLGKAELVSLLQSVTRSMLDEVLVVRARNGATVEELQALYGVSRSTVRNVLRQAGL